VAWAQVYVRTKWRLHPSSRLATIDIGQNWLGWVCPFLRVAGSPSNTVAWAEAYLHTKWHLDASSRLATIKMGRKLGALPPFWGGELGPHLTQCGQDQGPPPCQVPPCSIQLFSDNRHEPKIGEGALSLFSGGGLGPHLTQCRLGRRLPPYQVAS